MPPYGLYQMPRNYLYGGRTKPKVFNTKDFEDNDQSQPFASDPASPPNLDGAADLPSSAKMKKKAEKNAKKEKKRASLSLSDKNADLERLLNEAGSLSGDMSSKKKSKKKRRRSSEDGASEAGKTPNHTPVVLLSDQKSKKAASKRKRASETPIDAASAQLLNEEYLAGQKLPALVLDSLRGFGTSTPTKRQKQTPSLSKQSAKPKQAPQAAKQTPQATEQPSKKKAKRKSDSGVGESKIKKAKRKSETGVPDAKDAATLEGTKFSDRALTGAAKTMPVPPDWVDGSDELKVKNHKKKQAGMHQASTLATSSPVHPVNWTPVPFPQLADQSAFSVVAGKQRANPVEEALPDSNVLVPETPPSRISKKSDVPFPSSLRYSAATTEKDLPNKQRQVNLLSSPTPTGLGPPPSTAPAAMATSRTVSKLPSIPNALTDANLRSFKEPLNGESRSRALARSGASTINSFRTSSASLSIQEAFARVGKPYMRSGAGDDPFTAADPKPKKTSQTREEDAFDVFNENFLTMEKGVNWVEEDKYLVEQMRWDKDHQVVPCLNKMTGCTAKKEELLRQSKEEGMEFLAQLETEDGDLVKLQEASAQAQRAEDLLMLATKAHVPVPVGRIEGKWTLYSPRYAETHFDKYGYGQRTLVISSIAGFRHKDCFTARLQIPPRTMSYTILTFHAPPHASFRTTTVKTASEGYTVELIFLGNGYLQLRADLRLFLSGTIRKPHEEDHVMEFIGIHDKATEWLTELKDDVEEEGRKLFAKYDGHAGEE